MPKSTALMECIDHDPMRGKLEGDKIALRFHPLPSWHVQSSGRNLEYAIDENGEAGVKLAVANVPLDYNLWEGLRNPALVGLFPAGLGEIWEFSESHWDYAQLILGKGKSSSHLYSRMLKGVNLMISKGPTENL